MIIKLDLSSKANYLVWVDLWKEDYAQIANQIRKLKKQLTQPHKVHVTEYKYGNTVFNSYVSEAAPLQAKLSVYQVHAKNYLALREQGKRESWALKQRVTT
jgi:dienelactone hydrolase